MVGNLGGGGDDRLLSGPNFLLANWPCWNIWHNKRQE